MINQLNYRLNELCSMLTSQLKRYAKFDVIHFDITV